MPPNTVSVARPSIWGNPYPIHLFGRELALQLFDNTANGFWTPSLIDPVTDELAEEAYRLHCAFRKRLDHHPLEAARSFLRGKNVACWCGLDEQCHGDIWLRLANTR